MLIETIKISFNSLLGHKFRTFLTIMSVMIGVFSIIVMMSLAKSASSTLGRSVEEIGGSRFVWWIPKTPDEKRELSRYYKGITRDDINVIHKVPHIRYVSSMAVNSNQISYVTADKPITIDAIGILDDYFKGFNWDIVEGRDFKKSETNNFERVCIITYEVSKLLFDTESSIGKQLILMEKPYNIVGVLKKRDIKGLQFGFSWEKSIFIPLATAEKREGFPTAEFTLIAFTEDQKYNTDVLAVGSQALQSKHNGVIDFETFNFGEMIASFSKFFQILNLIVAFIASISLFAGGIGVMNIMLVSVTERVREIGIRKALGATRKTILAQFIIEATTLSALGGVVGLLMGLLVVTIAHHFISQYSEFWVKDYSTNGIALSLGITAGIGLFFGSIPAYRAAKLDIIECLRR